MNTGFAWIPTAIRGTIETWLKVRIFKDQQGSEERARFEQVNNSLTAISEFCGLTNYLRYEAENREPGINRELLDADFATMKAHAAVVRNFFVSEPDLTGRVVQLEDCIRGAFCAIWNRDANYLHSLMQKVGPIEDQLRQSCVARWPKAPGRR